MTYQEEKQIRLRRQSSKQAITLAIQGRWREAIAANGSIIESFPNDVEAYNRLGKAYMELGEYEKAREAYNKSLGLDRYNSIARRNMQRLAQLGSGGAVVSAENENRKVTPQHFIEETGKAGIVSLYNLTSPEVLARVMSGDRVNLKVDGQRLIAESGDGEYLGQVDSKQGQRLIRMIKGGNKYEGAIVNSEDNAVSVIIREVYRDPSQAGQPSFPGRQEGAQHYVSDRIFRLELEQEVEESSGFSVITEEGVESEVLPEELAESDEEEEKIEE